MSDIYAGRALPGYQSPNGFASTMKIFGGLAGIAIAAIALLFNLDTLFGLRDLIQTAIAGDLEGFAPPATPSTIEDSATANATFTGGPILTYAAPLGLILFGGALLYLAIRLIFVGLLEVGKGLLQRFNRQNEGDIPGNFESSDQITQHLIERTAVTNGEAEEVSQALFGPNVKYMSPLAGKIARPIAKSIRNTAVSTAVWAFGALVAIFVLAFFVGSDTLGDLGAATIATLEQVFSLPVLLGAFLPLIILFVLVRLGHIFGSFAFVRLIVPKGAPQTESKSRNEMVSASKSPLLLINQLPNHLEDMEWEGFPNRVTGLRKEQSKTSLSDSGDFEVQMLIERQPKPIDDPHEKAGRFLLMAGWAEVILSIAVFALFVLPRAFSDSLLVPELTNGERVLLPLTVILFLVLCLNMLRHGRDWIEKAERLLDTHWFRSPLVFVRLRGNETKGKIRVGKAMIDSIETETDLIRTDFLTEMWASDVISEWAPNGTRYPIALRSSDDSKAWLDRTWDALQSISAERVKPTGVDLAGSELSDIVVANQAINTARNNPDATHPALDDPSARKAIESSSGDADGDAS